MVSRQYFTIQTSSASPTFCKQNFCQMPRSGKINAFGTFFDQKAETKYIQNFLKNWDSLFQSISKDKHLEDIEAY